MVSPKTAGADLCITSRSLGFDVAWDVDQHRAHRYRIYKQVQMARFDAERLGVFGPLLAAE
jgi:hypothetical protein